MNIIFYSINIEKNYIAEYHNCNIRPLVDDGVILNNKSYVVRKIVIEYDENTIYVFVERE